jgi:AAA domain
LSELPVQRIAGERHFTASLVTLGLIVTSSYYAVVDTIRPGAIFACTTTKNDQPILGVVKTGNRDYIKSKNSFVMSFYDSDNDKVTFKVDDLVTLIYVTQVLTPFRCYEALTTDYPIHFESNLLGHAVADDESGASMVTDLESDEDNESVSSSEDGNAVTDDDSDEDCESFSSSEDTDSVTDDDSDEDCEPFSSSEDRDSDSALNETTSQNISDFFHVPVLNDAQDKAAKTFLTSKPGTITIVQGPPGTGKTMLLVTILCRYFMESKNKNVPLRRIVVSAPTNKAVTVLATRFLKVLKENSNVNVLLVGDADQLFSRDSRKKGGKNNKWKNIFTKPDPLESIFLFTWTQRIVDGFTRIHEYSLPAEYFGRDTLATLLPLARLLRKELGRWLRSSSISLLQGMDQIVDELESQQSSLDRVPSETMVKLTDSMIHQLKRMGTDKVQDEVR